MAKARWHPQRFIRKVDANFDARLDRTALMLQSDIVRQFKKGNPTPPGNTPSAPGEVPAVVTGTLKRSIAIETPRQHVRRIGSTIQPEGGQRHSRAIFLEFGTRFMAARPWLRPSLERNKSRIKKGLGAR